MPSDTTQAAQQDRAPLKPGRAIKHVREELHVDERSRPIFTQPELHSRCAEIEEKMSGPSRRTRFKASITEDRRKKNISLVENDKNELMDLYKLGIFARAFDLPEEFFYPRKYRSIAELEHAFRAARGSTMPMRSPGGFRRIGQTEPLPQSRRDAASRLTELVAPDGNVRASLVVLEGHAGVGKSYFIGHWFRDHGHAIFGPNALVIDCSTRSLDQLLPMVEVHFAVNGGDGRPLKLADSLAEHHANLIVLDGLRLAHFREGTPLNITGPRPSLRELGDLVANLINPTQNTIVICCLENNGPSIGESYFLRSLNSHVALQLMRVKELDETEGAELLKQLGAPITDERRRRLIAFKLFGMPLALSAAATELQRLDPARREGYLDVALLSGAAQTEDEFTQYFREYLKRLDSGVSDDVETVPNRDPHPHALYRLLALMPGPISRVNLQELLEERRIRRLKNQTIAAVMRGSDPFIKVMDDRIDLHAMVRKLLRDDMDRFVQTDKFDSYTSRKELEWLHWKCALLHWRALQAPRQPGSNLATDTEAFVYHMMAQIRVLPKEGPSSRRRRTVDRSHFSDRTVDLFKTGFGKLSDVQLWLFALSRAVRPFLLDKPHITTRVFGQYETKARVLQLLLGAVAKGGPRDIGATDAIRIQPHMLANLQKEVAVCWMHAGRLLSAKEAIVAASDALGRRQQLPQAAALTAADGATQDAWRLICDIKSVSVIISVRQGRLLEQLTEDLRPFVETAEQILSSRPDSAQPFAPSQAPALEGGALRIIQRRADLQLHTGYVEASLRTFETANIYQKSLRARVLDGEAARRYVMALVRSRDEDLERFVFANEIVAANIRRYESGFGERGMGVLNDIVPFFVLQAGLKRIGGDLEGAASSIEAVKRHEYVRRGECTYVAGIELEFEEIRLDIARWQKPADAAERRQASGVIRAKSLALAERLEDTHHMQLHHEANLLAAEVASEPEQASLLYRAREFFHQTGARMRLDDIAEIEGGGSAVMRYGL